MATSACFKWNRSRRMLRSESVAAESATIQVANTGAGSGQQATTPDAPSKVSSDDEYSLPLGDVAGLPSQAGGLSESGLPYRFCTAGNTGADSARDALVLAGTPTIVTIVRLADWTCIYQNPASVAWLGLCARSAPPHGKSPGSCRSPSGAPDSEALCAPGLRATSLSDILPYGAVLDEIFAFDIDKLHCMMAEVMQQGASIWRGVVRVRPPTNTLSTPNDAMRTFGAQAASFLPSAPAAPFSRGSAPGGIAGDSTFWRPASAAPGLRSINALSYDGCSARSNRDKLHERAAAAAAAAANVRHGESTAADADSATAAPGLVMSLEEVEAKLRVAAEDAEEGVAASPFRSSAAVRSMQDVSYVSEPASSDKARPDPESLERGLMDVAQSYSQLPDFPILGEPSHEPPSEPHVPPATHGSTGAGPFPGPRQTGRRHAHQFLSQTPMHMGRNSLSPIPSSSILPCLGAGAGAGTQPPVGQAGSGFLIIGAEAEEDQEVIAAVHTAAQATAASAPVAMRHRGGAGDVASGPTPASPAPSLASASTSFLPSPSASASTSPTTTQADSPERGDGSGRLRSGIRSLLSKVLRRRAISSDSTAFVPAQVASARTPAAAGSSDARPSSSFRRRSLDLPRGLLAGDAPPLSAPPHRATQEEGRLPQARSRAPRPPAPNAVAVVQDEESVERGLLPPPLQSRSWLASAPARAGPAGRCWADAATTAAEAASPRPHSNGGLAPVSDLAGPAGQPSRLPVRHNVTFNTVKSLRVRAASGVALSFSPWMAEPNLPAQGGGGGGGGGSRIGTGTGMQDAAPLAAGAAAAAAAAALAVPLLVPEASHAVMFAGSLRSAPTAAVALAAGLSPSKRQFSLSARFGSSNGYIDGGGDGSGGDAGNGGGDGGGGSSGGSGRDSVAAAPAARVPSTPTLHGTDPPSRWSSSADKFGPPPPPAAAATATHATAAGAAAGVTAAAAPVQRRPAPVVPYRASAAGHPSVAAMAAAAAAADAAGAQLSLLETPTLNPCEPAASAAPAAAPAGRRSDRVSCSSPLRGAAAPPGGSAHCTGGPLDLSQRTCPARIAASSASAAAAAATAGGRTFRMTLNSDSAVSASGVQLRRSPLPTAAMGPAAAEVAEAAESEGWHEIWVRRAMDPVLHEEVLIVTQHDVTDRVVAERHLGWVMETEHRLLEQLYPRHILASIVEDWAEECSRAAEAPGCPGGGACCCGSAGPASAGAILSFTTTGAVNSAPPSATTTGPGAAGGTAGLRASPSLGNLGGVGNMGSMAAANSRWRPAVRDPYSLATWHPQVTLLFADVVGFTPMCKEVEPRAVMHMLNALFSRFDSRLDEFNVFKVETIGDCYFVAGGLVDTDEDGMATVRFQNSVDASTHVRNVFRFAQAMLEAAQEVPTPTTGAHVRLRIGMHVGPVVSGVVGTRMPRFCLFGDTVNTASRMESTGVPGCVHVSEAAYASLRDEAEWEPTGGIEVKGKGHMHTFLYRPREPSVEVSLALPVRRDPTS